ncbi:MAG: SPOR domain-containing protein [Treponema sp.]|jgi:hypothetical protein|nr:SPOR domain-containing protein [Treponema sp.]
MRKIIIVLGTVLCSFLFLNFEGAGAPAGRGELPENGYYVATNDFPRNTIVEVTNPVTNRSVRARVYGTLEGPAGLTAKLSREAAAAIGLETAITGRIRIEQFSERRADTALGPASGGAAADPDRNPQAQVIANAASPVPDSPYYAEALPRTQTPDTGIRNVPQGFEPPAPYTPAPPAVTYTPPVPPTPAPERAETSAPLQEPQANRVFLPDIPSPDSRNSNVRPETSMSVRNPTQGRETTQLPLPQSRSYGQAEASVTPQSPRTTQIRIEEPQVPAPSYSAPEVSIRETPQIRQLPAAHPRETPEISTPSGTPRAASSGAASGAGIAEGPSYSVRTPERAEAYGGAARPQPRVSVNIDEGPSIPAPTPPETPEVSYSRTTPRAAGTNMAEALSPSSPPPAAPPDRPEAYYGGVSRGANGSGNVTINEDPRMPARPAPETPEAYYGGRRPAAQSGGPVNISETPTLPARPAPETPEAYYGGRRPAAQSGGPVNISETPTLSARPAPERPEAYRASGANSAGGGALDITEAPSLPVRPAPTPPEPPETSYAAALPDGAEVGEITDTPALVIAPPPPPPAPPETSGAAALPEGAALSEITETPALAARPAPPAPVRPDAHSPLRAPEGTDLRTVSDIPGWELPNQGVSASGAETDAIARGPGETAPGAVRDLPGWELPNQGGSASGAEALGIAKVPRNSETNIDASPTPGALRPAERPETLTVPGTMLKSEYMLVPAGERPPPFTLTEALPAEDTDAQKPGAQPDTAAPSAPSASSTRVPLVRELERGKYYLQLAAMSKMENVEAELARLGSTALPVKVQNAGSEVQPVYRILIGPVNLGESGALLQQFKVSGYRDAFVRSN